MEPEFSSSSIKLPRVGDVICGKYEITRALDRGGMGMVFEASHLVTGKSFALKYLLPEIARSPDGRRRFIREARAASRLKHPAIVEIYDVQEDEGALFLVMELLSGESLHQRLKRAGPLSPAEARRILLPCMRGIARAHAAGIVHRDLKPPNIFLCAASDESPEFPKVLDFGISRLSGEPGGQWSVTDSGILMGTPHYIAPEQLDGDTVDHRADIYAFGVILYEVLSGHRPFQADSLAQLLLRISQAARTPLRELQPAVSESLAAVVERALARDVEARFQNMTELIHALERAGEQSAELSGLASEGVEKSAAAGTPHAASKSARSVMVGWTVRLAAVGLLVWAGLRWRDLAAETAAGTVQAAALEASQPHSVPATVSPANAAAIVTLAPPAPALLATPSPAAPAHVSASAAPAPASASVGVKAPRARSPRARAARPASRQARIAPASQPPIASAPLEPDAARPAVVVPPQPKVGLQDF